MADIARNPVERFIGGRRSMAGLRLRDRLNEINVPTLVMGGDRDTTVGVDNILAEYQALPQSNRHIHMFHGAGHSPNVDVARWTSTIISQFSDMAWSLDLQAQSSR
jgi:pimeloyl-ACP methyl ester carboxylesterase